MTAKRDKADREALEALVAASLRCPDQQPDITDCDIKRFVEDNVTLGAEDEAALARSKPELMRRIQKILKGRGQSKDCVRGSGNDRGSEIPIPARLSDLAARENLTVDQTLRLLNMRLEIKAHRSNAESDELEKFDWDRFYDRVKEYLG